MKSRQIMTVVVAVTTLLAVSVVPTLASNGDVGQDLAQARGATARFHDVDEAIAAGYVASGACVAVPGLGAMGTHYVSSGLVGGPTVDPATPEMLLYVPGANGEPRLVGVEYMKVDADQNLATDSDRPTLFGQPFDGPMLGHGPGNSGPIHYDLHVWVWQANPSGLFSHFNPSLSC